MGEESGRRPGVEEKTADMCGLQQALVRPASAESDRPGARVHVSRCASAATTQTEQAPREHDARLPRLTSSVSNHSEAPEAPASAPAGRRHQAPRATLHRRACAPMATRTTSSPPVMSPSARTDSLPSARSPERMRLKSSRRGTQDALARAFDNAGQPRQPREERHLSGAPSSRRRGKLALGTSKTSPLPPPRDALIRTEDERPRPRARTRAQVLRPRPSEQHQPHPEPKPAGQAQLQTTRQALGPERLTRNPQAQPRGADSAGQVQHAQTQSRAPHAGDDTLEAQPKSAGAALVQSMRATPSSFQSSSSRAKAPIQSQLANDAKSRRDARCSNNGIRGDTGR